MNVCELKPEKVFKFFELISSVPHGSDNTDQISALCCKFAAERGLDYIQDEVGNVIIRKSARYNILKRHMWNCYRGNQCADGGAKKHTINTKVKCLN